MIYPFKDLPPKNRYTLVRARIIGMKQKMQLIEIQLRAIGPNTPYKHMWWKVDLGAVYNIKSIEILFKNYESFGMYVIA